ncbi:MAG TPA: CHAT domain-containing tetratricopeptide repeat protein [Anaerolineae bacterium]|nr:CHAT domain-containing tetratricopeptide repeat protein [Anaerolineae bacterium]
MTSDEFIVVLSAASDAQARQALLAAHPEHFCLDTVRALKSRADWAERDDARQALMIGRIAEELAESLDSDEARGYALWAQANAHDFLAEYEDAVKKYEQAAQLLLASGQALEAARTRIGQFHARMYLGQYEAAQALSELARPVFVAQGDVRSQATIDMNLGIMYVQLGQHSQALDYFQRAHLAYQALDDSLHAAFAQVNQANVLVLLDDFLGAEQLFAQARPVFEVADLRSTVAMVDHDIAFLQYAHGDYAEAFRTFERARTAFDALGMSERTAYIDVQESEVYLDLNLPEEALRLAERAEHTFREVKNHTEIALAQVDRALALARLGHPEQALTLLNHALDLFTSEGNEVWATHVDLHRAEVLSRMGERDQALAFAMHITEAYRRLGLKTKHAYASLLAADLFIEEGRWEDAQSWLQTTRDTLNGFATAWLTHRIEAGYGRVNEGMGNVPKALQHYRRAAETTEQMAVTLPAEEQRTAFIADKLAPYEGLVALTAPEYADEAFGWAERAKSRALVDLLAAGVHPRLRMKDKVDAIRAERLRTLREELNWFYTRLTRGAAPGETGPPAAGPEVWEKIQVREREVTALWRDLQAKHAEHLSLQRVTPLTVEEVQAGLTEGTALVEYFIARGQVVAFVLSRKAITAHPSVTSLAALRPLLEGLFFQLSKGQYGSPYFQRHRTALLAGIRDVLAQLYQALLAPLWPELADVEALIIVPHGPLHRLPFHALEVNGQPLIETHAVSYAPSAAVLKFCWDKPASSTAPPLLVGAPDDGIARVAEEVQTLTQLFPHATCLLGGDATFDRVCQLASSCGLLHFAAHGLFRPEAPLLSGIRLTDRWLAAQDVYDLELNASLVTLSACESGLGHVAGGDDLVGLVRGFLYAGAASILVSLWMVDDEAIARLMTEFYKVLLSGETKARALRQAQRAFWREYEHPYFWAPLELIGRER